jgi:ribosomal protein S18 acetylase RimI-like enzyme
MQGHIRVAAVTDDEDGFMAGFCIIMQPFEDGGSSYIQKLHVRERYRNLGIGSTLIDIAKDSEKNLSLLATNKSIGFYKKHGFKLHGRVVDGNETHSMAAAYYGLPIMSNCSQPKIYPFALTDNDLLTMCKIITKEA